MSVIHLFAGVRLNMDLDGKVDAEERTRMFSIINRLYDWVEYTDHRLAVCTPKRKKRLQRQRALVMKTIDALSALIDLQEAST